MPGIKYVLRGFELLMTETTQKNISKKNRNILDNIKEALKVEENVPGTWASLGILDTESYFGAARTLLVSHPCLSVVRFLFSESDKKVPAAPQSSCLCDPKGKVLTPGTPK